MTEDDKEALKEFLQGAGIVGFVVGSFILGLLFIGWIQNPPVEEQSTKVVDTYNGCDILRYAPPLGAKYQYFMDCDK